MGINRRDFIKASSLTLAAYAVSSGLQSCAVHTTAPGYRVSFEHGVASGDPLADRVIIWTRVTPEDLAQSAQVIWQTATDPEFRDIVREGALATSADQDFTVKVDLVGLAPATRYYYRFSCAGATSQVGRTKTLPVGALNSLKLAFFSCSNYPAGYFNAYADAARREDLDVALHLGDYIYEYGSDGYATKNAKAIGRELPADNSGELFTLEDYRKRYALYRTDKGCQALHRALPLIAVWDDHEVANDTWREGAENHNEGEGDFTMRKLAALRAYFEWMPIRPLNDEKDIIYRSFDFGDLVSLHMLDTRICGRDERFFFNQFMNDETLDVEKLNTEIGNPERQLLGGEQYQWLLAQMQQSGCQWQLLGQQLLMARMHMPAVFLSELASRKTKPETIKRLVTNARRLKAGDTSLSREESNEVLGKIPYNLDAWDGYAAQRNEVLNQAGKMNKKLIVIAGDTHNAWASILRNAQGEPVGAELGTASVSSPGMETFLTTDADQLARLEAGLPELVDDLQFCDLQHRGYAVLNINREAVEAELVFIDNIQSERYQVKASRRLVLSADELASGWQFPA